MHKWLSLPWVNDPNETYVGCYEPGLKDPPLVDHGKYGTACKHGKESCETCGTSIRRDYPHKTSDGKGVIARIRRG